MWNFKKSDFNADVGADAMQWPKILKKSNLIFLQVPFFKVHFFDFLDTFFDKPNIIQKRQIIEL